ncbi:hypothetical protein [Kineococcus glutinatus]|uniref:Integral membrane protein n=1 Tax=Kineococcus glutinatus TaxID=1070872 RepID=A0ABP9H4D5_9ACTN
MEVPAAPPVPAPAHQDAPAPPDVVRRPRATWQLFRAVLLLHAAVACAQPLLAGSYFAGNLDAIGVHGVLGTLLGLLALVQLVAAVLLWYPGRGPWWPAVATVALFLAEGFQIGIGYERDLGLHVPLGVGIVATLVALAAWSLRWRPQPRRRPGRGAR